MDESHTNTRRTNIGVLKLFLLTHQPSVKAAHEVESVFMGISFTSMLEALSN